MFAVFGVGADRRFLSVVVVEGQFFVVLVFGDGGGGAERMWKLGWDHQEMRAGCRGGT